MESNEGEQSIELNETEVVASQPESPKSLLNQDDDDALDMLTLSAQEKFLNLSKPVPESKKKKVKSSHSYHKIKIAAVGSFCCFCSYIFFILTVLVSVMFFVVFHVSEVGENNDKMENLSLSKLDLLDMNVDTVEKASSSVYAFYEGSSFVDYGEFITFCEESNLENSMIYSIEWIMCVPHYQIINFTTTVTNYKLPIDLQTTLNETDFGDYTYHWLVSYIFPEVTEAATTNSFGKDLSEDDLRSSIIESVFESLEKEYLYLEENEKHLLELYIPVKKSGIEHSLFPKEYQNGVIRGVFNLEEMIDQSVEDDEWKYYLRVNDNFIFSSRDGGKQDASSMYSQEITKELPGGIVLEIETEPSGTSFYDSPFLTLKYVFLILPFFCCVFVCLLNCGVFLCCRSFMITRYQNRLIRKVVKSIVLLQFDDPIIMRIRKSKKGKRSTEGLMKKLIKQILLYRKFLPQTLLAQIEENQKSDSTTNSSHEVRGVAPKAVQKVQVKRKAKMVAVVVMEKIKRWEVMTLHLPRTLHITLRFLQVLLL